MALVAIALCSVGCAAGRGGGRGWRATGADELVGRPQPLRPKPLRREAALWYQLDLGEEDIEVRVRLMRPAARTTFFLPGPWAGQENFSRHIGILGASGPGGDLAVAIDRGLGRVDVESNGQPWVELRYRVGLGDGGESVPGGRTGYAPRRDGGVLLAYAPTILVLPSEQVSRQLVNIPVEIRAPRDWQVVTTWPEGRVGTSQGRPQALVHGYVVADVRRLRDTFVAAGPGLEVRRVAGEPVPISVSFSPGAKVAREALVELVERLVGVYGATYGPPERAHVLVQPSPGRGRESMRGTGRRGGFVLELPDFEVLDDELRLLVAHEAFHMWNGHELVPEPLEEPGTRWFKEGLTHYVALQALAREGLVPEETVRRELARAALHYQHNPSARGEASRPEDRVRLPYDQGLLLALGLDAALHRDSGGHLGLGDWLVALLEHARRPEGPSYDAALLRQTLLRVVSAARPAGAAGGPPRHEALKFWDRHVLGRERLDPLALFHGVGLHWLDGPEAGRLLPMAGRGAMFEALFGPRPSLTKGARPGPAPP